MKVIVDNGPLPERYRRSVAAIGVFDGMHLGHQEVIARAVAEARRLKAVSVVITFAPHPVSVLRPADFSGYVLSLEHRLRCMAALGVQVCYVVPFSRSFARLSAKKFIVTYLAERLRAIKVVVGEDFHFGHGRIAAADAIASSGRVISVEKIPLKKIKGVSVKTRLLRSFVQSGDLAGLRSFLGRHYSLFATVIPGLGFGRRLGFPTANLSMENIVVPPSGIYFARVTVRRTIYAALFYIGHRPTLKEGEKKLSLEAYLLDFHGSLYGQKILVELLRKMRDDRHFPSKEALSAAITKDVARARKFFSSSESL